MHDAVAYAGTAWLALLLGAMIGRVLLARSLSARILALDALTLVLVGLLTLISAVTDAAYYLDAALTLALVSFVGTLAAALYRGEGRTFS